MGYQPAASANSGANCPRMDAADRSWVERDLACRSSFERHRLIVARALPDLKVEPSSLLTAVRPSGLLHLRTLVGALRLTR